jgi:uncharacterized protein YndB with AHSA1/START domain
MTSRVIVSIRVPCSPIQAFEVFTEEIGDWWAHSDLFRFTPRSPGKLAFEPPGAQGSGRLIERLPNGKEFKIGDVREWSPGERLVVGWRQATFGPDHATEVEIRFEPVGAETRVTVEHRGWDSVPQDHLARHGFPLSIFQQRQGEQWRAGLERLRHLALPNSSSDAP